MSLHNDHPLTLKDEKYFEAVKHENHKIKVMGRKRTFSHRVPQRFYYEQKFLCIDCHVMFIVRNWEDRKDIAEKLPPTELED